MEKLLKFYTDSDVPKLMDNQQALHQARTADVDKGLHDWIKQLQSEKFPHSCSTVVGQVKEFHKELGLFTPCEYSSRVFQQI
jgi:hypothetical protein